MPEYFPTELVHRKAEMKAIAEAIKPLIDGHQSYNLFIPFEVVAGLLEILHALVHFELVHACLPTRKRILGFSSHSAKTCQSASVMRRVSAGRGI